MLLVFAFTLFTSATLLFMVEPMIGKMILPLLGGTPAVWNTCMVFYQAVLLAGYAYAHFSTSWLGARKQAALHLVLLALPFLFLPLTVNTDIIKGGENPILGLLLLLSMTVGLPMFVVSASAPLLQKWFADTSHPSAKDPYFLYGASNLGSMLALLAYPTVVEPNLRLGQQSIDWTVAYGILAGLTALCAVFLWRSPQNVETKPAESLPTSVGRSSEAIQPSKHGIIRGGRHEHAITTDRRDTGPSGEFSPTLTGDVTWLRVLRWVALAFVPSSLMLGATTYITTDIAAIPLLWVTPLALYLLSFIIVFSHVPAWLQWLGLTLTGAAIALLLWVFLWDAEALAARPPLHLLVRVGIVLATGGGIYASWWGWFHRHADMLHRAMVLLMPPLVLMLLFFLLAGPLGLKITIAWSLCLHLATLLVVAMVCHGELARDRPAAIHLTGYYLWMSVGGVLGGLFNALVAPVIFTGLVEYPLAMMLACLLAPPLGPADETAWGRRFDLALTGLFAGIGLLLIFLRLPDDDLPFKDLRNTSWLWEIAALIVGVTIGVVAAERARENKFARWMDLVLPVSLGLLLIGLSWGLQSNALLPRVRAVAALIHRRPWDLIIILTFGAPLVLAYTFVERSWRFALAVGAVLLAGGFCSVFESPLLHQERGFFGVLRISNELHRYRGGDFLLRRLDHGTTLHGMQCLNEERRDEPLTYYHHTGPIGALMLAYNGPDTPPEKMNLAVIGLGTGCMATHVRKGQHLTFYDIDPIVKRFSFDENDPYFTFVQGARERGAKVDLVMGDARLTMARQQLKESEKYGMIVVDAFSSDAIPVHLITLQALDVFLDKLTADGLIVFHISNRYLNLAPVLYNLAQDRGLSAVMQSDNWEEEDIPRSSELMAKTSSSWVVLSPKKERLNALLELNDWEDERQAIRTELLPLSLWPDNGIGLAGQAMLVRNFLDEEMCKRLAKWETLEPEIGWWPDLVQEKKRMEQENKGSWTPELEQEKIRKKLESVGVWTDDYSNLFSVFSWR
jgi:SAM-dependent methyltransferase